ncbi:MAG TPA: dTDP-4-dehydrorhamnose 3,5-epimerase [Chryseosolibacter sp.]
MQVRQTGIEGLVEIIPSIFSDDRGWFYEFYNKRAFDQAGITHTFVQENTSFSKKGVIRGLHFQNEPHAQGKLVTVLQGKVVDVVVDLRPGSKTFCKVYYQELDAEKRNMLMVPEGFAHGFAALEDTVFFYKCTNFYNKAAESGIVWNDPQLNIQWPVSDPIVSDKDRVLPTLEELLRK